MPGSRRTALAAAAVCALAAPAAAQTDTDIHLLPLGPDLTAAGPPRAVACRAGYENQPAFTPDGAALLYTWMDAAGQADIRVLELDGGGTRDLVRTRPESEYSAEVVPGGDRVSAVRVEADSTQRLWTFGRDGGSPALLFPDLRPVGYYAWLDERTVVAFVLGDPPSLWVAGPEGRRRLLDGVGRSIRKVPGVREVSVVVPGDDGAATLEALDPRSGGRRRIAPVPAGTQGDHAWTPDGRLLAGQGSRLLAWDAGAGAWEPVADLAAHGIRDITRLAVAPDGRTAALVASEPEGGACEDGRPGR